MTKRGIPWMLAAKDLRGDLPFFGTVGLVCGVVQWTGYSYFDKANWGSDLLEEHIAFNSLLLTVMFLWLAKVVVERLGVNRELPRASALVAHISARAVAFASVAAAVIAGFALAAGFFGAFRHAATFLFFCSYFVSIAEIAANPVLSNGQSRIYPIALGIIIGMPFAVRIVS
ncbi:hypothetical protein NCW_03550 [Burkholderia pseudomallei]|uniref:hypothetical protein n=1 Tax=Burkholderia pseudomallei TaxID=28450 RepID=UPI000A742C39|nr:hypothetical protein [Burkholderia pseudomallei]